MSKSDDKKMDQFTPEQLEELAGDYKHTDNPRPEDFSEEFADSGKRNEVPERRKQRKDTKGE